MKQFLIHYQRTEGTEADWHRQVAEFIAELEADPELAGRVSYRCLKSTKGPDYYHLATPADETAVELLGARDFFRKYTAQTETVSGGSVTVTPLEVVAETK